MAETAVRARSGPLAIPARRRAAAFPPRQAEVVNRVDEEMRAEMIECQAPALRRHQSTHRPRVSVRRRITRNQRPTRCRLLRPPRL